MKWIVLLAAIAAPARIVGDTNPQGIEVRATSDTNVFVWSHQSKIIDVRIEEKSEWWTFWPEKHHDGMWSITMRDPSPHPVILVTVDEILWRTQYRLDEFGYEAP